MATAASAHSFAQPRGVDASAGVTAAPLGRKMLSEAEHLLHVSMDAAAQVPLVKTGVKLAAPFLGRFLTKTVELLETAIITGQSAAHRVQQRRDTALADLKHLAEHGREEGRHLLDRARADISRRVQSVAALAAAPAYFALDVADALVDRALAATLEAQPEPASTATSTPRDAFLLPAAHSDAPTAATPSATSVPARSTESPSASLAALPQRTAAVVRKAALGVRRVVGARLPMPRLQRAKRIVVEASNAVVTPARWPALLDGGARWAARTTWRVHRRVQTVLAAPDLPARSLRALAGRVYAAALRTADWAVDVSARMWPQPAAYLRRILAAAAPPAAERASARAPAPAPSTADGAVAHDASAAGVGPVPPSTAARGAGVAGVGAAGLHHRTPVHGTEESD